jgi:hypothetical protein
MPVSCGNDLVSAVNHEFLDFYTEKLAKRCRFSPLIPRSISDTGESPGQPHCVSHECYLIHYPVAYEKQPFVLSRNIILFLSPNNLGSSGQPADYEPFIVMFYNPLNTTETLVYPPVECGQKHIVTTDQFLITSVTSRAVPPHYMQADMIFIKLNLSNEINPGIHLCNITASIPTKNLTYSNDLFIKIEG